MYFNVDLNVDLNVELILGVSLHSIEVSRRGSKTGIRGGRNVWAFYRKPCATLCSVFLLRRARNGEMSILTSENKEREPILTTTTSELMLFIQAAHVGQDTNWDLDSRGAIALVAPPEALKTKCVENALRPYPDAQTTSDMNVKDLSVFRDDVLSSYYHTLAFLDYQKLWERDERTSANVEGAIRAFIDEGWQGPGEKGKHKTLAKCFMIMCMTEHMYDSKFEQWKRNGFGRRLLVMKYHFRDRRILAEAIKQGHSYQLSTENAIPYPSNRLLYKVTPAEADYIELALKDQRGLIPLQLLLRVYNSLKWYFDEVRNQKDRGMQVLMNVLPLLQPQGGELAVARGESLTVAVNNDGTIKRQRKAQKTA